MPLDTSNSQITRFSELHKFIKLMGVEVEQADYASDNFVIFGPQIRADVRVQNTESCDEAERDLVSALDGYLSEQFSKHPKMRKKVIWRVPPEVRQISNISKPYARVCVVHEITSSVALKDDRALRRERVSG
mgnify:CR=1 FL=1